MASEETWVYLIRHGETEGNVHGRWGGQRTDDPLNAQGLTQAAQLGARLAEDPLDAIYASDLTRTLQTARAIADAAGLPVQTDVRLREIDFGAWDGLTQEEIMARDAAHLAAFGADFYNTRAPGGESFRDQGVRVTAAFNDIVAAHPGEHVAVVTHGGAIITLLYLLYNETEFQIRNIKNTAVTLLRGRPGAWETVRYNDVTHLDGMTPTELMWKAEQ